MVGQKKNMMGSNVQLPRLDRGDSMFRDGRTFQPAPNSGLGQVRLRMPVRNPFDRPLMGHQVVMGQQQQTTTTAPAPTLTPPPPKEQVLPPKASETAEEQVKRHPAMRLAWGKLKKLDAKALADQLADVIARMHAKGIPPGMVAQIQARLANFAADPKQAPGAEVEITEHEVQKMEQEILSLEEAEAQPEGGSPNWLIAVGAAVGLGLLIDWLSD